MLGKLPFTMSTVLYQDSTFSYFDLQLRNDMQYFDEIFRKEALRHGEHACKISLSENGCYGNRN